MLQILPGAIQIVLHIHDHLRQGYKGILKKNLIFENFGYSEVDLDRMAKGSQAAEENKSPPSLGNLTSSHFLACISVKQLHVP